MQQSATSLELALKAFKKHDKYLRLDSYNTLTRSSDNYRGETVLKSGLDEADELTFLIDNVTSTYYVSAQSIYQWCGVTVNCLKSYLQEIADSSSDETMKQHHIVFQLLEGEIEKMRAAQEQLQAARVRLDEVSVDPVVGKLKADFDQYNGHLRQQTDRLESSINESKNGVLSAVRANEVSSHLQSTIDEFSKNQVRFEQLNRVFEEAIKGTVDDTRASFKDEVTTMIDVIAQTERAYNNIYIVINENDPNFEANDLIKNTGQALVDVCKNYRARHE